MNYYQHRAVLEDNFSVLFGDLYYVFEFAVEELEKRMNSGDHVYACRPIRYEIWEYTPYPARIAIVYTVHIA